MTFATSEQEVAKVQVDKALSAAAVKMVR